MKPLIPIEYSAEEQAAVADLVQQQPGGASAASAGGGGGGAAAAPAVSAEALKQLISTIPTKRDELYAEQVDWDAVGEVIERKLRPFIGGKIKEYLGEEEPSLVEHIVGKLKAKVGASEIEAELAKVLDDDAQVFVVKLWRMLLFEMRAKQAGLAT